MEGQLTIFDWQAMKEDIRRKLQETAENFVYIGYKLRQIDESEGYKHDGASSIYEFAEKEYGLTRTVTQRFMAINARFSIEGNSTELLPQYKSYGSSKLQEMLTLSEQDCELLTEKATVKDIRELKNFNRQQESEEEMEEKPCVVYTKLQECIIDFFKAREKREILNAVMKMAFENEQSEEIVRQQAELINPAEFANHTKGIIYLFLYAYDRGVAYKTLVNNAVTKLTWKEFVAEIILIYGSSYGPDTWCNFYGPVADTVEVKKEEKMPEKPKNTESEGCATSHKNECSEMAETVAENTKNVTETQESVSKEAESVSYCEETDETEDEIEESVPVESASCEGEVVQNPYFTLQKQAKALADQISHTMYMYERMVVEAEAMKKVVDNVHSLAAVVEQMTELGEEMDY